MNKAELEEYELSSELWSRQMLREFNEAWDAPEPEPYILTEELEDGTES